MSLEKQIISIPMSLGMDTENAPPLVDNQRFTLLENVVFNKDSRGQMHKRSGHTAMSTDVAGGGLLPAAQVLALFNEELDVLATGGFYGYSESGANWSLRGSMPTIQPVETAIAGGQVSIANPDLCSIAERSFYVYEMGADSYVKVIDEENKSVLKTIDLKAAIGSAAYTPKILVNGTNALVLCTDGVAGNLWAVTINGTTFATSASKILVGLSAWFIGGDVTKPEAIFDALILSGTLYVAAIQAGSLIGQAYNATTLAAGSTVSIATLAAPAAISMTSVGTNTVITWQALSGTITSSFYDGPTWTVVRSVTFGVGSAQAPRLTSGQVFLIGSAYLAVFWEQAPVSPQVLSTINLTMIQSGVIYTAAFSTGTNIASQPFVVSDSVCLLVVAPSTVQQTYFLLQQTVATTAQPLAAVRGRFYSNNNSGPAPTNYRIPGISVIGGQYLISNTSATVMHVNGTDLNFSTASVGPVWTKNGSVPYNITSKPIPSVGTFTPDGTTVNGSFQIAAGGGNPLAFGAGQSFCVTAIAEDFTTFPPASGQGPVVISCTSSADNYGWWITFDISAVGGGTAIEFEMFNFATGPGTTSLIDHTPALLPGEVMVVSVGYDDASQTMLMKVNDRPIVTMPLGYANQAPTISPATIGTYHQVSPSTDYPLNGLVYEAWASTDVPSNDLFTGIYDAVQRSLVVTAIMPVLSELPGLPVTLSELSLSFDDSKLQSSQLGQNLHLATGGMLCDYDGTSIVEHNFNLYPETPTISYLTSQLAIITDGFDPNFAAAGPHQGVYRIMIPDNAATPGGPVGQLITPGEYITFYPDSAPTGAAPYIVYFTVNGIGSAPTGTGVASITACPIQSSMTATQVAQALSAIITPLLTGIYTVSFTPVVQTSVATPQTIGLFNGGVLGQAAAPPVLNRFSTATQVYVGAFGTSNAVVGISVPPANLISSGQYVTFASSATFFTSQKTTIYAYFTNPTNPTVGNENKTAGDPKPFGTLSGGTVTVGSNVITWSPGVGPGNYIGVSVPLVGTEDAVGVAVALSTAINNVRTLTVPVTFNLGGGTFSCTQQSNNVDIVYSLFSAGQIVNADFPTTNVGLGYVGVVVANSTQPYAAIDYSSVYENVDAQNQLHQSAPSVPAIAYIPTYVTTTATVNNNIVVAGSAVPISAVVKVSTNPLSLTQKTAAVTGTDLDIAIYRTISGATVGNQVFYRITPASQPLLNQPASNSPIPYADYSSDTAVQSNQLLYTTGGVISDNAPPACSIIINHQNRLWLAGLENPNQLWYSEQVDDGFEVAFSNLQTILVNPIVGNVTGGPIVALASMDSNLIVFQKNQVWFVQGNGPDPTGGNGFFSNPQVVASSSQVGCRDPNSVVLMPNGIMFKSTQGFYILGRDLQLKYIGSAVKTYNLDIVTSAVAVTSNSQINFLSSSGTTLVYDWFYDCWGTFTTSGLDSATDASGLFIFTTNDGAIWIQTPGMYVDGDDSPVLMTIQTAWLKTGKVQGFQRIWKAFLEGQFYGTQPYQVEIAYNYVDAPVDTFIYQSGAGVSSIGTWGGSPTWGATIWGEDGGSAISFPDSIQIKVYPSNQPCQSIQFTISDLSPSPESKTWSLNALDLEIGVSKGGMKRIGPPQSLG